MNHETAQLVDKLAQQLGTTSKYLFGVLVRQAPIDGMVDLAQYGILTIVTIIWVKAFRGALKRDYMGDARGLAFCLSGAALAILLGVAFFSIPSTVAAFFNPEYWALQRILAKIG